MASKSKVYTGILYPDSTDYNCTEILEYITSHFSDYAYIFHDSDVYPETEVDDDGVILHTKGDLKKSHYHIVIRLSSARSLSSLAKELGLKDNYLQTGRSYKFLLRYLIHLDQLDKHQYPKESIIASHDISRYLLVDTSETEDALKLYNYITETTCTNPNKLLKYAIDNNCWSTLRRGSTLFNSCLSYNNYMRSQKAEIDKNLAKDNDWEKPIL